MLKFLETLFIKLLSRTPATVTGPTLVDTDGHVEIMNEVNFISDSI